MSSKGKYHKLWCRLKTLNMTEKELIQMANLPKFTLTKMKIGMPLSYVYLTRICNILHCEMADIFDDVEQT